MEEEKQSHVGRIIFIVVVIGILFYVWYAHKIPFVRSATITAPAISLEKSNTPIAAAQTPEVVSPVVSHLTAPAAVNAIYISSWSAGTPSSMAHIDDLLAGGKINSVVVDIKDATGRISYMPLDPTLLATGAGTKRISNLSALITSLHNKHIYVIGRIAVFQDPYYPTVHPEAALQDINGGVWKDSKGITWLREDNPDVWHYIESIAEDAYAQGFDEINVDYVRFPSDGKLKDIDESTFTKSKEDTIADFFTDLDTTLRQKDHIPLSADVFGLTVSANDDMGIGQKLELIAPHVDYISPMIYPSHFADGSYGFKNPAEHPYDVIHKALTDGIAKLTAAGIPTTKLRPWLQDFNLGAIYTPEMVQAQINASDDVGVHSWLFWDASNKYTSTVFK